VSDSAVKRARSRAANSAKRLLSRRPRRSAPKPPPPPPVPSEPEIEADPRAPLVEQLERGLPLDVAVIDEVRSMLADDTPGRALSLAESLLGDPGTNGLGRVAAGVVAHERSYGALAWAHLREVPPAIWARLAPAEYVRSGLAHAPDQTLHAVGALVDDDPPGVMAESWYEILAAVFGYGDQPLARRVYTRFDQHVTRDVPSWPEGPMHRDWMRSWVAADAESSTAPAPADRRPVLAIMDYGHPGATRASANIGDHIQSIASLAHVVRHRGVRLHGDDNLVELLTTLRDRVRPEFARDDLDADLEVIAVHRDASMYQPIPEGTWVLCLGWYMHALFTMRHGFPLHRNLRPVFVSFHCNKRSLLTPDAVDYLRRYGPVGCRDWTTTHLLTSMGVPAFFSGCLTTTIGGVFPDAPTARADAPVAYVDVQPDAVPEDAVTYGHSSLAVRRRSFVANAKIALARLDTYRREHSRVITSRLHCHLPLRSIGMETEFLPVNPADVRFSGLIGITDQQFDAIRSGLTEKLERVLRLMIAGAPEADVYAQWRAATADDVAAAERELRRGVTLQAPAAKWAKRVPQVVGATKTYSAQAAKGEAPVDCAVSLHPRHIRGTGALLDSLVERSSRPIRLWALVPPDSPVERLVAAFPEVTVNAIPFRSLGKRGRQLSLVLLPGLIPDDVERLVVLPTPAVVTADVCELADLDLGSHALAAPTRLGTAQISGFGVINTAANRLRDDPAAAAELRRAALARHGFDFDAFSVSPLVLDLGRLRREGLMDEALKLASTFRLNDVEILHYLMGPDRARVPERWAVVPTRTPERGSGLRHWADAPKPWNDVLTPERELFRRHAVAV
jgi:hypothetical protein